MPSPYELKNPASLLSPSLLIFRELVRRNLDATLAMAGRPDRLRPHVKTHKMPALVHLQEHAGVRKHKCATIAEAEMLAAAGASDVLIAFPLVGPNVARLARLMVSFPGTTFRTTVDSPDAARALSEGVAETGRRLPVLLDLDVGMGRTGIEPGRAAEDLYATLAELPALEPDGLHAYDGHVQIAELGERRRAVEGCQQQTFALRDRLTTRGLPVPRIVFGGTPSFPIHAALDDPAVELSPGTSLLYDVGYATKFPDLPFVPAATLLTRVVSRPRPDRLCLDLGHKAVAADPKGARLRLLDLPDAEFPTHSEEHLVAQTPRAGEFPMGTPLIALPVHICPTCALHRRAYVIEGGEQIDEWEVAARDRVIGV
jgi:D-serine deaminase-like pyridoxal phosphate-dependent protein